MAAPTAGQGLPPDWNEDRRPNLYGASIFFIALTVLTVLTRLACQLVAQRRVFWDDFFVLLALVFNLGLTSADIFGLWPRHLITNDADWKQG